jgi:hypothetical protein
MFLYVAILAVKPVFTMHEFWRLALTLQAASLSQIGAHHPVASQRYFRWNRIVEGRKASKTHTAMTRFHGRAGHPVKRWIPTMINLKTDSDPMSAGGRVHTAEPPKTHHHTRAPAPATGNSLARVRRWIASQNPNLVLADQGAQSGVSPPQ